MLFTKNPIKASYFLLWKWTKRLLCFENASKELVAILVLPCSLSVCVAAPSYYGDRQVARSWRVTAHCSAAVRPAV